MAQEPSSKDLLEAVKQQESGGRRYKADGKTLLEGPQTKYGTAKGEMQVLDMTNKDPGFGVRPAKDDSPDERARVGQDYLNAMVKRYGDRKTALVAYNWGPGNTDKWLKKGGDFAKLPEETQNYVTKITGSLGATKLAQATPTKPKSGVQRAVYKAAPLTHPMLSQLGPSFQAAMAVSMLADEGEKEGKSEYEPSEAEKMLTEVPARPVALAQADLSYQSPFPQQAAPAPQPQPQQFAVGGTVVSPAAGKTSADRKFLDEMKGYTGAAQKYQQDAVSYYGMLRDERGNPVIGGMMAGAPAGSYNVSFYNDPTNSLHSLTGLSGYNQPIYQADAKNLRLTGFDAKTNDPRLEAAKTWAKSNNVDPNLIGYFTQNIESISPKGRQSYVTAYDYNKGQDFGTQMAAPADLATPVNPVTGKAYTTDEATARGESIKKNMANRQMALNVAQDPASFGLSMSKVFNQGGMVHRAEGSPETGERMTPQQIEQLAADQVALNTYQPPTARPSTGMNRQRGPISDALDSGAAYINIAKGMTDLPYDIAGAPRDISNFIMSGFGKSVEKPVMGSEFLKEQATKAGIRPLPPTDPTLKGFFTAGEIGAGLINPAGVMRKGIQATEAVVKGAKKAKDMLGEMRAPKEVPQTTRAEPTMTPEVQTEMAQLNRDRQFPRDFTQPPNPWMGVAPTVDEAQANVAARQANQLPPPPAEVVVPPALLETPPVAPPMQASMPAERPFVGRLDLFIDTLTGPVQLGQLKGQLKGKFRDYDLERIERAFPGMAANTKLTPDQIKQALAEVHSPQKWISETVQPKAGAHHQSTDNVWGAPLGTTNLYIEQAPEALAANELLRKAAQTFNPFMKKTTGSAPTAESLEKARTLLADPELMKVVDPELISNLSKTFDKVEKNVGLVNEYTSVIKNVSNGLEYPILYKDATVAAAKHLHQPFFKFSEEAMNTEREILKQRFMAQGSNESAARNLASSEISANFNLYNEKTQRIASQKVQELAMAEGQKQGIFVDLPDVSLVRWDELADVTRPMQGNTAFKESVENALEPSRVTIHEATKNIKNVLDPEIKKVGDILYQRGNLYEGRHKGVAGKPYPIGFTRFSEHEATITGMGTVQGRHFHELQSDLSKDMRKAGTTSGSAAKDIYEYDKLQRELKQAQTGAMDKLQDLQTQKQTLLQDGRFSPTDIKRIEQEESAVREALDKGTRAMEKRISILGGRVRDKASYSLQEPFAGFETNQMVRQQLLMKNAIQSAMRDGKGFATFPGNESAQPALYVGKIQPNLKQVIKDLGGEKSGLELRQIELPPDKDGRAITATGVVWSPEAAARIMKTGVPFAKGGLVDRLSADTRRYL